uniref:BTB domain-containing protein n=1 Tax=Panagrolaimus davidi TaxID=227884 RepID=A0A914Q0N5_9BILA
MTFTLTDECAKDHTTQITVQIDISQETVVPYFLKLDKKLLQSLKDGESANQIIKLPGYNFLTFKCSITKIAGFCELFIENLTYDIRINDCVKNYSIKLVVGDNDENCFIYKLNFSFNPDVVRQQYSESAFHEAKKSSGMASQFPVAPDSAETAPESGSSLSHYSTPTNWSTVFHESMIALSIGLMRLLPTNSFPLLSVLFSSDSTTHATTKATIDETSSSYLRPQPRTLQHPKKYIPSIVQKEHDFNRILAETKYTDAILVNQSGEKVLGFRCFLGHISPVFQAIFDSGSEIPVKIEVGNFKEETLQQVIQFSQGAEFEVNENVMELLEFAKTFSINLLIDGCYTWIANNINEKNVCQYIKFAYAEDNAVLKKHCLEFLKNNKLSVNPDSIKILPQEIFYDAFFS